MYRSVQESQTLLINQQMKDLLKSDRAVIKFGFGQSPFLPPKSVMSALSNSSAHKEYTSVQGDFELRTLISKFHYEHNGLQVNPENILLAPGSKSLLFSILMAHKEADVLIPSPSWVSYAPQAALANHNLIRIHTSFEKKWRITPEALLDAIDLKKHEVSILILNYPGNPDGLSYTLEELNMLTDVFRSHNVLVISDEIYGLLDFELQHKSLGLIYPEKTITTTGLSKWCGAGGWRFGTALLHDNIDSDFKKALIGIGSETYSCAPTPVQMAAKQAYQSYQGVKPYLARQVEVLKDCGTYCSNALRKAKVRVHDPVGGFYIFPDFSEYADQFKSKGISSSTDMCARLLEETGVALLPASAFGFGSDFYAARLAYVDFEDPSISGNYEFDKDCRNIISGIELITNWLKAL